MFIEGPKIKIDTQKEPEQGILKNKKDKGPKIEVKAKATKLETEELGAKIKTPNSAKAVRFDET